MTYPQITRGIARNMMLDLPVSLGGFGEVEPTDVPTPQGGGNLNGSSNTAHTMGQAGTGCDRISLPRQNQRNYTGII
jgi:hypothetical protein